jgi:hypothetical protein
MVEPGGDGLDSTQPNELRGVRQPRWWSGFGWREAFFLTLSVLVFSNAWWVYQAFDHAVTDTYQAQSSTEMCHALQQVFAMLPRLASGHPAASVIETARVPHADPVDPYQSSDGFTVVGELALAFEPTGALSQVELTSGPLQCPK